MPWWILLALGAAIGWIAARRVERARSSRSAGESGTAGEKAQLGAILAGMNEGVVAVDADRRIVHMNAAAKDLFCRPAERCVGAPVWKILRPAELVEMLEETLGSGREREMEVHLGGGGASAKKTMEVRTAPLRGGEGGAVLVFHDVTRLRHLENMRRDFVANVSHEIKTPLASIRGMVETMIDDPEMEEATQARFLQRILRQTQRMGDLIKDLLALSRFENEEVPLVLDRIDMGRTVLESVEQVRPAATAKELHLETEVPEGENLMVWADPEALRQVFDNLLGNAVRYTPEGGALTVSVGTTGSRVWAEVADTGVGVGEEHLDRIFERFCRVDRDRSRELGGTGLGLSIVKHVMARLGGGVTVQSRVGEGSRFRVHLPRAGDRDTPAD